MTKRSSIDVFDGEEIDLSDDVFASSVSQRRAHIAHPEFPRYPRRSPGRWPPRLGCSTPVASRWSPREGAPADLHSPSPPRSAPRRKSQRLKASASARRPPRRRRRRRRPRPRPPPPRTLTTRARCWTSARSRKVCWCAARPNVTDRRTVSLFFIISVRAIRMTACFVLLSQWATSASRPAQTRVTWR